MRMKVDKQILLATVWKHVNLLLKVEGRSAKEVQALLG